MARKKHQMKMFSSPRDTLMSSTVSDFAFALVAGRDYSREKLTSHSFVSILKSKSA